MNHSIYSADRSTHLKIVVVGLTAAIGIAALATSLQTADVASDKAVAVIKAGRPTAITSLGVALIR
jgi:hypothetical protein